MGKMNKIWGKFIEFKQGFSKFLCRISGKMREQPLFANLSLLISAAGIVFAFVGLIVSFNTTVKQSESTNVLVVDTVDSSTQEIVSAIETSGKEIKETIETSNEVLGTRIVSELGTKIESSNEILGTRIVSAIENLGSNQVRTDEEISEVPAVSVGDGESDNEKTINTEDVHEFLMKLLNGTQSAQIFVEGKPTIDVSISSEQ